MVDKPDVQRFAVTMPAELGRAGGLRRLVTAHLCHWRLPELAECATLVAHELYANAVVHGSRPGDDVTVEVEQRSGALRIAVTDTSPALPAAGAAARDDEHGRGLSIVEWVAGSWDARIQGGGKVVSATLPLTRRPDAITPA